MDFMNVFLWNAMSMRVLNVPACDTVHFDSLPVCGKGKQPVSSEVRKCFAYNKKFRVGYFSHLC